MAAEYAPEPVPIVWAVPNGPEPHPPAHPVPKPIVGRVVEPACGDPFFASALFDREPFGRTICQICRAKYLGGEE